MDDNSKIVMLIEQLGAFSNRMWYVNQIRGTLGWIHDYMTSREIQFRVSIREEKLTHLLIRPFAEIPFGDLNEDF